LASRKKPEKTRRPGLGANPLDVLMPEESPSEERPTPPSKPRRSASTRSTPRAKTNGSKAPEPSRPKKVRSTYHLPEDLVEELRNAALFLAGPPEFLTLSGLVESALRREVERLRKKHHKGKPFPQRPHDLRGGRPVGS